jgi:hypothetical protein
MQVDVTTIIPCLSPSVVKPRDLEVELRKLKPDAEITGVIDSTESGVNTGQGLMFEMDGLSLAIMSVNVPLPIDTLVYGLSPNFFWLSAQKDLAAHACHARVLVIKKEFDSRDDLILAARAQTLVTAAVSRLISAMGVLWCASDNLLPLDRFLDAATTFARDGRPPAEIWVRLMAKKTEDGLLVASHGLAYYAGRELEVVPTRKFGLGDLSAYIFGISSYLIENYVKLGDAITMNSRRIGISHREKATFDVFPAYLLKIE